MLTVNPPKRYLFGPGPTQVADRVYDAMHQPVVGHLDPYFFEVVQDIQAGLRTVYGTANPFTLAISGTGSAGMEAAVSNFAEPGTKFLVFHAGFFADRLCDMGQRHGAQVVKIEKPWGEWFTDAEVREAILREQPATVGFVHAETSTGVLQDGSAICKAAHEIGALVIADCVTSLGALPVNADETGIDIGYSCTQKGLSCPPGLSPITVSERAMERLRARTTTPDIWYLDLKLLDTYYGSAHRYHHTAPISTFYALKEGLALVQEEGLDKRIARHKAAHELFVSEIEAMGLRMHVAPGHRIPNLNTVVVPDGVDELAVRKRLLTEFGIEISGGFGPLAGKIFRVGLMGPLATSEGVAMFLDAFKKVLGK
jgi:alanine-glyoxylate transaminase / serine-glyoxylate transaminase / serine-pyruvate transaminase